MDAEHQSQSARDRASATVLGVFLVDDHAAYRQCLKDLLAADAGFRIAGEAGNAAQALAQAQRCAPAPLADIVVLDVAMPGMNGVALAQRLRQIAPQVRLLALSMHDDASVVRAMLAAGAGGYMVKSDPLPELLQALRTVAGGGRYLSDTLGPELKADLLAPGHGSGPDRRSAQ